MPSHPIPDRQAPASGADVPPAWSDRPIRMLYLYPDTMGPEVEPKRNALYHLSRYFTGDQVAFWIAGKRGMPQAIPGLPPGALGRFRFHWAPAVNRPPVLKQLADFWYMWRESRRLMREHGPYDVIVTYGTFRTAIAGLLLKWRTGTKLIVQSPAHPTRTFDNEPGYGATFKRALAANVVRFVVRGADHVHLMYPTQFDGVVPVSPEDRERRLTAFPDFTPVGLVPESGQVGNYFLFVGYPWERKGVDVLIKAWKRLAPSFPGVTLKIVGFCPDLAPWEALRGDETSIEFHRPRPHPEIMKLMANCAGFVLPSRCEGVARVLVEAMAAGKPVVTTAVDGHPFHVRDGETGYLVPPDDVDALAAAITRVLADPERAARLGAAARTYVRAALSEEQYVERFHDMAERTLHGGRPRRAAGTEDPSVRPAPAF